MTNTDELVNAWLTNRFKEVLDKQKIRWDKYAEAVYTYNKAVEGIQSDGWKHGPGYRSFELVPPKPIMPANEVDPHFHSCEPKVVSSDASWDCCCYSEYTRDDSFEMTATVECLCGEVTELWRYGAWGSLPEFIEELDAYREGPACGYDNDDWIDE